MDAQKDGCGPRNSPSTLSLGATSTGWYPPGLYPCAKGPPRSPCIHLGGHGNRVPETQPPQRAAWVNPVHPLGVTASEGLIQTLPHLDLPPTKVWQA